MAKMQAQRDPVIGGYKTDEVNTRLKIWRLGGNKINIHCRYMCTFVVEAEVDTYARGAESDARNRVCSRNISSKPFIVSNYCECT